MAEKQYPKVVVYSTTICPWCHRAKSYLREKGVPFKDILVDRDQNAAREMIKRSGQMGVPVIMIGNKPIVGFDKVKIDKALGL